MAKDRMTLLEQVRDAAARGDLDLLRDAVKKMTEALRKVEVAAKLGAGRQERTAERTGCWNGHRIRDWDTRDGTNLNPSCQQGQGSLGRGFFFKQRPSRRSCSA
jgi:transposase-like protein